MAMKKSEKRMMIGIVISLAVFAFMDPYYLWRTPEVEAPKETSASIAASNASAISKETKSTKPKKGEVVEDKGVSQLARVRRERPKIEYEDWGRDPFVQEMRHIDFEQGVSKLKLNGISVRGDDKFALINSSVLRTGDTIGDMRVKRIEADHVVLSAQGRDYILRLGSQ